MLFDNVIEQIQASKKEEAEVVIVKLGEVTSVTPGGRAYVKLYGDGSPSTKLYTYIDGYFPEQGDKVALLPQGKTYIILGKVNDENPVEIYAKIKWVEENFCPIEYKHKLEDVADASEDLSFSGYSLIPTSDNKDSLGSAAKNFKEIFIKKLTLDGESFTKIYQDRIFVVNSGTTYSLIATYAAGTITLTPSTNDSWALGTSAAKLKEIWTDLFRGAWKSGQSTERQLSWNSSNALVPDANNSVDLGSASYTFKQLFLNALVGAKYQYQTSSANNIGWNSATELAPNNTNVVDLGSSSKQFNKVFLKELYINGTQFDPSGVVEVDKLTATYGSTNYTLTLSVKSAGSSNQYEELAPSIDNKFNLGSASYKFQEVFASTFTGDLNGKIKASNGSYTRSLELSVNNDGNAYLLPSAAGIAAIGNSNYYFGTINVTYWAKGRRYIGWSSNDIIPDSNNTVSLGTSSRQYKNIYGQNIYVNGAAVSSDRRLKEEIEPLDEKHVEFFKNLKPVSYKFKDGTSGRKHTGFIAQEVEEAVEEAGLTDKDMAVVVKDKEDNYYLRYEEIIAVQTNIIQKLMTQVESLEARVNKLETERSKS